MTRIPAPVAEYFRCVNEEDWAGLEALFTDDAEIRPVGTSPRVGRERVVAYYPEILAGFATHLDEVVRALVDGDAVATELRFTGTTRDARPVAFDAVDLFDLAGDRIRRVSMWYDTIGVARQVRPPQEPAGH